MTNSIESSMLLTNTTNYDWGTNFLTISNREWIRVQGAVIIRVTDAEWKLMTNFYRTNVVKEKLSFYGVKKAAR
jgi:hypothetical protein